ncbi:MAG TPA: DUF4112 domain-containing protein [Longimicrobiaceae bacterium]|jgi:hypothetical protein|nr:DUF4112 domain-containing protein [Longimicrobiaceae bacterium]
MPDDLPAAHEHPALRRVKAVTMVMDNAFRVPVLGWRVGLDPILGLVPGIGDAVGAAASAYVVLEAARLGAGGPVLVRMVANVVLDTVLGAVPVLGDVFDFGWKSNSRNVELLRRSLADRDETKRSSRLVVGGTALVLVLLFAALAALLWFGGRALLQGGGPPRV